jgi:hypothetical protein
MHAAAEWHTFSKFKKIKKKLKMTHVLKAQYTRACKKKKDNIKINIYTHTIQVYVQRL